MRLDGEIIDAVVIHVGYNYCLLKCTLPVPGTPESGSGSF